MKKALNYNEYIVEFFDVYDTRTIEGLALEPLDTLYEKIEYYDEQLKRACVNGNEVGACANGFDLSLYTAALKLKNES